MDDLDMILAQRAGAQGTGEQFGLSGKPYYIQELDRKMDRLEYKLDLILKELGKGGDV